MQKIAQILIDQSHRQAWSIDWELASKMNPINPKDASYLKMAEAAEAAGFGVSALSSALSKDALANADVLVLPHASEDDWEKTIGQGSPKLTEEEIQNVKDFVERGGGLVVLGETEQSKYGNNFAELTEAFGIGFQNETVQDGEHNLGGVATWVKAALKPNYEYDLGFQVSEAAFYRAGTLKVSDSAAVVATSSSTALPADAPIVAATTFGKGRVVVLADSDVFGDDSIEELDNKNFWINIASWVSGGKAAAEADSKKPASWAHTDPAWLKLSDAIEALRPMQEKDGSIDSSKQDISKATAEVVKVIEAVNALAPRFSHQSDYLAQAVKDIQAWVDGGFGVPDFYESLELFRPDLHRNNNVENLAVFSMYTQNGNPNRNLEAVITNTFWPDWLAEKEKVYQNSAFVPIEFVAFTSGYDTNSAVFFPETVATRELAKFYWGGIFCDREAARFRMVTRAAQKLLYLPLPPDAERLVNDQLLAQETFVLWDLIHDRTHSRGDLPFDPFMIKQRMPFWMYALEELRCDLSTFRETFVLDEQGERLGKYIRYAILFDRLFRFPITGPRVRNYDGLGGQIIFSYLHRGGALTWTDNRLTFDWEKVNQQVVELCEQVEKLYHDGIDRSRLAQWMASYEFVRDLVQPHPASRWAKGDVPVDGELKEVVNAILDDEFPLNVFYDTLNRKLKETVEATKGITA
ncbi:MAG: DUF6421 family protein [Actinomycetota bacterium]